MISWSVDTALNLDLRKSHGIDDTFGLRGARLMQTADLTITVDTHSLPRTHRGSHVLPACRTRTFVQTFPPIARLPASSPAHPRAATRRLRRGPPS